MWAYPQLPVDLLTCIGEILSEKHFHFYLVHWANAPQEFHRWIHTLQGRSLKVQNYQRRSFPVNIAKFVKIALPENIPRKAFLEIYQFFCSENWQMNIKILLK